MKSIKPLLFKTLKSRMPPINDFVPIQRSYPLTYPVICKGNYYPRLYIQDRGHRRLMAGPRTLLTDFEILHILKDVLLIQRIQCFETYELLSVAWKSVQFLKIFTMIYLIDEVLMRLAACSGVISRIMKPSLKN